MRVIKRNGKEVAFDLDKIIRAIKGANKDVEARLRLSKEDIIGVAEGVRVICESYNRPITVEEIDELVKHELFKVGAEAVHDKFLSFRYDEEMKRRQNTIDARVLTVVNGENQDIIEENSNKDPIIAPTQRDYIAGEVSKDITERYLLPPDIVEAHKKGILHFHDADYFISHIHNCCLVNLEDMLQNGTVINKTKVEKPHSFATACTIATQVICQVSSASYGGQTITLTHLAPFVNISREKYRKQTRGDLEKLQESGEAIFSEDFDKEQYINEIAERNLKEEIRRGVQTMQYQINTISCTNGQTPFVSVTMYLNEAKDERTKEDLALIIEEMLKQRIEGVKNEKGMWITPTFPKLLYFLEEDNIHEGDKYYYLTELAAKCTAKRMVPDYISEKIMLENKIDKNGNGNAYGCMGCRSFLTPYVDEEGNPKYYGRLAA